MTDDSIVPSLNELMTAAQDTSCSEKSKNAETAEDKACKFDATKWYLQDYHEDAIIISKPNDSFFVQVKMYFVLILYIVCSMLKMLFKALTDNEKRKTFLREFKENKQGLLSTTYNTICDDICEKKRSTHENIIEYIVVLNPKYIEIINSN